MEQKQIATDELTTKITAMMDNNTLRAVAIVFNLLLIGSALLLLSSNTPGEEELPFVVLVLLSPGFSLAALLKQPR